MPEEDFLAAADNLDAAGITVPEFGSAIGNWGKKISSDFSITIAEIDRAMAVSIFDAANRYLGVGVGEHLGYLFTGAWTLMVSALIFQGRRILALSGVVISLGVMAGMLEPFGAPMAADINAIGFSLWALWALWLGVALLLEGRRFAPTPAAA
jgi:hypothetical protein